MSLKEKIKNALKWKKNSEYCAERLGITEEEFDKVKKEIYAEERENVIDLVKTLGYKPNATTPSTVRIDIYQTVPSKTTDGGVTYNPDMEYALQIDAGATCRAKSNSTNFRTLDIVDFK